MKTYRIARYRYVVDIAQDGLGHLELLDKDGTKIGDLSAVADNQKLPPPRISADQSAAVVFVHVGAMQQMLNLLRTDDSLVMRISSVAPGFVTLESERNVIQTNKDAIAPATEMDK